MSSNALKDLANVVHRLTGLEEWWREQEAANTRKLLAEAAALPQRQAAARKALAQAEAALAEVTPDGTKGTHERWRESFKETVRCELAIAALDAEARALWLVLSVELWNARKAHWMAGLAEVNEEEQPE
ncbi:hypothetical protein ACLEPN_37845 [Myxococcus sp. 1LA]